MSPQESELDVNFFLHLYIYIWRDESKLLCGDTVYLATLVYRVASITEMRLVFGSLRSKLSNQNHSLLGGVHM
jgi:hypothetical protein